MPAHSLPRSLQAGEPKRARRGGRRHHQRQDMKRKNEMRAEDCLLGVDDPAFQVPKRRHLGEVTRQNEVTRLVHRHLLGAFDTLATIREVACDWPAAVDTVDTDTDPLARDSESLRAILELDANANCESGSESDGAGESLRATSDKGSLNAVTISC